MSDWSSDVCSSDLREAEDAVSARVAAADVVLGRAHAPADGERTVVGQRSRDALHLRSRHAGHPLGLLGVPLGDLGLDLVHAVDALAAVLLVLPAVLEDMPEDAPAPPHVGPRAEPPAPPGVGAR